MREKQLSKRLQAVVALVTPGRRVADVGCDHAYVSIYLIEHGLARECMALDVREGPLQRAKENIAAHRLSERIQTRLGSGLEPVGRGEVDTVLMAGMGGILIRDLLEESRTLSHSLKEWVLQPQSDVELVRGYIRESGFHIIREEMVWEDGKYYPMFCAVPEQPKQAEQETQAGSEPNELAVWDRFGALLLRQRHPVLYAYLKDREQHYAQVIRQMQQKPGADRKDNRNEQSDQREKVRAEQLFLIQQEADYVKWALQYWEGKGE